MSGWRRMLALFALASFVEVVAYGQLTAFMPLHLPRLGVAPADVPFWVGAITAGSNVLGLLFLPFWGALADRLGRKLLILRSFAATAVALAVGALAGTVLWFASARSLTALALGNTGLMMTTLTEAAPAARIALAFGILNGAGPLGALAGPLIGGPLVDRYGFAWVLALDAAVLAAVVALLAVGYRDPYARPAAPPPLMRSALGGVALLWRSQRLRALFPALFVMFAGWMLVFTYTPLVVERIQPGEGLATAIGLVMGAGGLTTIVASPVIGALADRYGIARTFFASAVLSGVSWILPFLFREYAPFLVAWAIANGLGAGAFSLSFNLLSRSATEATRARVMTFSYLPLNLGLVIGPAIGAAVASADPFLVFPTALVLVFAGTGLTAFALRRPV